MITLRGFEERDHPLVQEVSKDPWIPMITSVPRTADRESALAFVRRQHARLTDGVGYSFAVADADGDGAIGQIGLWPQNGSGRASVGYWVAERHRGRGVATRALRLVSEWGFRVRDTQRLELYVEPWNEGSWRAAERAGYLREGLLRSWQHVGDGRRDMFMYSLLRPTP